MRNPLADLETLARVPASVLRDLENIADAVRSLPAIEELVRTLSSGLRPLMTDVERLRDTVEPQQQRVAHIEHMMEGLSQRTIAIEQAVLNLEAKADAATKLLPDPDDDRSPLVKAKDALTGG